MTRKGTQERSLRKREKRRHRQAVQKAEKRLFADIAFKASQTPLGRVGASASIGTRDFIPAAVSYKASMGKPTFINSKSNDGRIRVIHREFMGDVVGTADYSVVTIPIQPGIPNSFPWLSSIAVNYETYHFKKLRFHYLPQCPSTAPGAIYMACDFDATETPPANKRDLMSYWGAIRAGVWSEASMSVDSKDLSKYQQYYVRNSLSTQDLKLSDVGNFFIATQGAVDFEPLGEIYVEYEIELITPQVNSNQNSNLNSQCVTCTSVIPPSIASAVQASTGGNIITVSPSTITFHKVGRWAVRLIFSGGALNNTTPITWSTGAGVGQFQVEFLTFYSNSTSTAGQMTIFVEALTDGAYVTNTGGLALFGYDHTRFEVSSYDWSPFV